jgi:putative spermidine/putrescine transport system ATP-binding protein
VERTLEMVGLSDLSHRLPAQLSGGQQQRVALARCIVYEPALILMDEPLGALDRKLRDSMQIEIRRLHRDTGATIVFVTHDQEEALALSDRICLMNKASIAQIGTPRELYARPASTFVADFIGVSNNVRGQVDKRRAVTAPEGSFGLPHGSELAIGSTASMVLRPEHIRVGPAAGAALSGTVTEAIFAGPTTRLLVRLDTGLMLTIRQTETDEIATLGQRVGLSWRDGDAQFLPA